MAHSTDPDARMSLAGLLGHQLAPRLDAASWRAAAKELGRLSKPVEVAAHDRQETLLREGS